MEVLVVGGPRFHIDPIKFPEITLKTGLSEEQIQSAVEAMNNLAEYIHDVWEKMKEWFTELFEKIKNSPELRLAVECYEDWSNIDWSKYFRNLPTRKQRANMRHASMLREEQRIVSYSQYNSRTEYNRHIPKQRKCIRGRLQK
jgi:hypothetical protein